MVTKRSEISVTSFDPDALKQSLIDFYQSNPEFNDINYEGSVVLSIIDLLVRNTTYNSFAANMIANESFLDTAQIRGNVSSHAQKLSYVPRSCTASRAKIDIEVAPSNLSNLESNITAKAGTTFLYTDGGKTYTFSTINEVSLNFDIKDNKYKASDVDVYQGKFIRVEQSYDGEKIVIPNRHIDTSTLSISVDDGINKEHYILATSLTDLSQEKPVYFLRENPQGQYEFEFGKDVVGKEPSVNSIIRYTYINTNRDKDYANGAKTFVPASAIGGYTNITTITKVEAYGGYDRDGIEDIRFLAPKLYQSQNRAVSASDYEAIIKQNFPFIRDIRAWGGEDNVPPKYGVTILSLVTGDGFYLTSTLEEEIKRVIRDKSVGSITPEIVEPDRFELNLILNYKLKPEHSTSSIANEVENFLIEQTNNYKDLELLRFASYYNEYKLIGLLQDNSNIETVTIDKTVNIDIQTSQYKNDAYEINFANRIKKGSFYLTKFECTDCPNEEIFDEDGKIFHIYYVDGFLRKVEIGSIDYDEGYITFTISFIQKDEIVRAIAEPVEDNFNTRLNGIVTIREIKTNRLL